MCSPSLVAVLRLWLAAALCAAGPARATGAAVPAELVRTLNAAKVANQPPDAEAAGRFSVDQAAHEGPFNFQAPGIAIVPLPGGRMRLWLSWYQQNNKPGGGAIGGGSISHAVYAWCDDPFGTERPEWSRALYVEPVLASGDETASDPEVFLLPDGRLLGSYITSGPGRTRKRSTYAFLIGNPAATEGAFTLSPQQWLGYGVLSQPFIEGEKVLAVIDEWNVARRFCRLEFRAAAPAPGRAGVPPAPAGILPAAVRDTVRAERISDIPWPGHPALTIFFEGSMHPVAGGRYRAYRRTKEGVYTTLSEPGGLTWGAEEKWTDHGSANSRSAFARSPSSGRVIGAVNDSPQGANSRTDLTLVVSAAEGAPGSFPQALNLEPDGGLKKIASQYPRLAFDPAGYVYCVYRWSDSRPGAPHHGAAITVARVREDRLAAGTATLAEVEKRVACEATPAK